MGTRFVNSRLFYCIVNSLSLIINLYALNKIPHMLESMSKTGSISHPWFYVSALIIFPASAFALSVWAYRLQERLIAQRIRDRQLKLTANLISSPSSILNLKNNNPEQVSNRIGFNVEVCERYSFTLKTTIISTCVLTLAFLSSMFFFDPECKSFYKTTRYVSQLMASSPLPNWLKINIWLLRPAPSNWKFALATLLSASLFLALFKIIKCLRRHKKEIVNMRQFENRATIDMLRGAPELRASEASTFAETQLRNFLNRTMKVRIELGNAYSFSAHADKLVKGVALFLIAIVLYHKGSFADMIAYSGTCWLFIEQVTKLFDLRVQQRRQNFAAKELAKLEQLPKASNSSESFDPTKPILEVTPRNTNSDSPKITINAGQKIGIVGPTGSGKSTLLRLIANEIDESNAFDFHMIRRGRIKYVRQTPYLFDYRLFENIVFQDKSTANPELVKHVESLIVDASLSYDLIRRFGSIKHALFRKNLTLSAGETAKVSFARALATNADLLLLDELTAHMDEVSAKAIEKTLAKYPCAKVIVTHKPSALKDTDYIYVMDDKKIVDHGTYKELLKKPGLFAKLHALETGQESDISVLTRLDDLPADKNGIQRALGLSRVFSSINWAQTAKLADSANCLILKSGDQVVRRGDVGDSMFSIISGEVEINGRTFGPGDSFGEIALFAENAKRTADVRCKTDCVLAQLSRAAVLELCEKEPAAAIEILKATATIAARESARAAVRADAQ